MSDAVDHGVTVTEIAAMDQPIDVCPETTAAFVGRALRGPLNTPVLVGSFGEFRRRFGDVWGRSSLGPSVRQFFDHGGTRLYIVRVANHARGSRLNLPANGSNLVLRSIEPGSTDHIRAAVDYDGIAAEDDEYFNLTLQRVDPANSRVIDQEYFQRLSWQQEAGSFVGEGLLTSDMARIEQPYPTHRPDTTTQPGRSYVSPYVEPAEAGTDGSELSDYDLIGSRVGETGLFALEKIETFDLLYLPPPGKGRDLGPAAVLAAEMYCRERNAMLISDPQSDWTTVKVAVKGVRDLGYASANMLSYFPRVTLRGSDDSVARPAGGALAGHFCKHDRQIGPWQPLDPDSPGLHRNLAPASLLDEEEEEQLLRAGLNPLVPGRAGRARLKASVTLSRGSEANANFAQLAVRRLCLQMVNMIAKGTRWAVFEASDALLSERLREQVLNYFQGLYDQGAFANDRFIVQCDAGVSNRSDSEDHGVTLLLVFQPYACDEPISLTLHQTVSGMRVGSTAFGLTTRHHNERSTKGQSPYREKDSDPL